MIFVSVGESETSLRSSTIIEKSYGGIIIGGQLKTEGKSKRRLHMLWKFVKLHENSFVLLQRLRWYVFIHTATEHMAHVAPPGVWSANFSMISVDPRKCQGSIVSHNLAMRASGNKIKGKVQTSEPTLRISSMQICVWLQEKLTARSRAARYTSGLMPFVLLLMK